MTAAAESFHVLDVIYSKDAVLVALCEAKETGEICVVKGPNKPPSAGWIKRFSREAALMREFAGPHVMPILDLDVDGDWYSMPTANDVLGAEVEEASRTGREELALDILRASAEGLRGFHAKGHVHRDLKPANILRLEIDGTPRWVVSDFGIARNLPGITTDQLTVEGKLTGSLGWAAPELYTDAHAATATADVYSLGAILGWILTNKLPTASQVSIPEGKYHSVILRATRNDPHRRYKDLDAMLADMERVRSGFTGPNTQSLADLLEDPINFEELSSFVLANMNNENLLLPALPKLSPKIVASWHSADPEALFQIAEAVCFMLADENRRAGLRFNGLVPPLSWVLSVLKVEVKDRSFTQVDQLAESFFQAVKACDQWGFNKRVAVWLKGLSESNAQSMIAAIEATGTGEYLRYYIIDEWSDSKSQALRSWLQ